MKLQRLLNSIAVDFATASKYQKYSLKLLIGTEVPVCTGALVLFCKVWGISLHLPLSVGSHEGCHVSSVGVRPGCSILTGADDERTAGTGDCQRMQQYSAHATAAGRGDAGLLQAPGLLRVYRHCRWRGKSVSTKRHCRLSQMAKSNHPASTGHLKTQHVFYTPNVLISISFELGLELVSHT